VRITNFTEGNPVPAAALEVAGQWCAPKCSNLLSKSAIGWKLGGKLIC